MSVPPHAYFIIEVQMRIYVDINARVSDARGCGARGTRPGRARPSLDLHLSLLKPYVQPGLAFFLQLRV